MPLSGFPDEEDTPAQGGVRSNTPHSQEAAPEIEPVEVQVHVTFESTSILVQVVDEEGGELRLRFEGGFLSEDESDALKKYLRINGVLDGIHWRNQVHPFISLDPTKGQDWDNLGCPYSDGRFDYVGCCTLNLEKVNGELRVPQALQPYLVSAEEMWKKFEGRYRHPDLERDD